MDQSYLFFISFLCLVPLIYLVKLFTHQNRTNLPPSPPSIPIIGHLHLISEHVHRELQQLSSKHGPIMSLRFGSRRVVVITSPSAAEECFTKNDIVLANRPFLLSSKYLDYDQTTAITAPYGQLWRDRRRIMTLEVFSTTRLKSYSSIREDEVRSLIKNLYQDCFQDFTKVDIRSRVQALSFNVVMRMISDKGFNGSSIEEDQFKEVIRDVFEIGGASNPGDFIPFLRFIVFRGYEKRLLKVRKECDRFSQKLIEEIRSERSGSSSSKNRKDETFIDTMLSLQESDPDYYTDTIIRGNLLVLIYVRRQSSRVRM